MSSVELAVIVTVLKLVMIVVVVFTIRLVVILKLVLVATVVEVETATLVAAVEFRIWRLASNVETVSRRLESSSTIK
jgi:hypothetical protein